LKNYSQPKETPVEPIRGPLDYHRYPPRKDRSDATRPGRAPSRTPVSSRDKASPDTESPIVSNSQADATEVEPSSARRLQELRGRGGDERGARFTASAAPGQDSPASSADAIDTHAPNENFNIPRLHAVHPAHSHAAQVMEAAHTPPEEARAKRRQRGRKRRGGTAIERRPLWKRVRRLVGFLLFIGWAEVGAAALTTKHFAVKHVETTGLQITSPDALQPVAASLVGQNWVRARAHEAELEAEKIPTVRDAQVVRVWTQWPPRMSIHISERKPFARVGGGQHWWVVDRAGVPFRAATKADENLYAVTASTLPGKRIQAGHELPTKLWKSVVTLADVLAIQAQQGQKWQLRRTYIDKYGFASLRLEGGAHDEMLVRLGAGRWAEKLERARQALAYFDANGKQAVALNLVSYSMPTWTPRAQPTAAAEEETNSPNSSSASGTEANRVDTEAKIELDSGRNKNSSKIIEENETSATDAT
jgi:cell division septal protein FtsQ